MGEAHDYEMLEAQMQEDERQAATPADPHPPLAAGSTLGAPFCVRRNMRMCARGDTRERRACALWQARNAEYNAQMEAELEQVKLMEAATLDCWQKDCPFRIKDIVRHGEHESRLQ